MSYLDFSTEPGVFALGGGLLDVDVRSPAAAARGLLPGVTPSSNELVGGFPSTYNAFSNSTYSPLTTGGLHGGGLHGGAGNPGGTLYDIGDPLIHAANHFDSARDMALLQAQHQMQQQQQPQQQHFQAPMLNPTASMAQASNYPHGLLSQPGNQWRHVANPPDGLRATPSPAPSSVNSLPGSNASSLAPERTCLVCSDEALGRHFGVLTCEACKSFFRRSVRTAAQYFCRYNRNCHVVKQSRNKCQYCRYQKCVRVGMQPDAVQEERTSATGKPIETKEDDSPVSPSSTSTHQAASSMVVASPASSWGIAGAVPADTKSITTLLSSNPTESSSKQLSLPALLDAERAWDGDQLTKEPITTPADFNDIVTATRDQLNYAIEWAKRVPPFTTLSLDDQVVVLKSVWNELLTLQLAFRASPFENTLILGSGQLLYRDQGDPDICRLVGRFIDEIVTPCRTMGLEMAELVAMKSIVLFNPDCPKLAHPGAVERLQEQCMEILSEYCHARFPEQKLRFSKILLRLSAVRSITTETRDYILQHHQHSNIQDADAKQAAAVVKKVSPDLSFALYKCLERIETQEAKRFTAWLGNCLSTDHQQSTSAAALYEFSLNFVPQLIWLHLDLLGSTKHREIAGGANCRKDIRLAKLENASIYHEASPRQHVTLTTSALQTQASLATIGRDASCPERIDRIVAANRSAILRFILSQYCESLGNRSAVSMIAFCHMCTRVCVSGFNLKASNSHGVSSSDDVFTPKVKNSQRPEKPAAATERMTPSLSVQDVLIGLRLGSRDDSNPCFLLDENALVQLSERTRHGLAPEVFQELATGVHVCMFNGQEQCGMQALNALHWRATESLIPQLLMMTRALLHALNGPCGSPEDGFYGLSAQTFSTLPKILQRSILNRSTVDGAAPPDAPHISVIAPSPAGTPRHSMDDLAASFPKLDQPAQPASFKMEQAGGGSPASAHRGVGGSRESASSLDTVVETLV